MTVLEMDMSFLMKRPYEPVVAKYFLPEQDHVSWTIKEEVVEYSEPFLPDFCWEEDPF